MGKKTKIGKQRKDNYYKLAKQKGFRSRAAFKLIQLNRKFQFLENSRVCIDLCAAPGGWCQVAAEYMPVASVIVGVDLNPITPIRNVVTIQSDITTKECSETLDGKLGGWKADVVLHDGAPNVGRNWLHDSYTQNVLVVSALKLACRHLNKGGWFITKIFRSTDYNSLLWVFGKLFQKVHATKPQASRSESAEIFVVCQNYKAPSEIDPKFFDPSALFADISNFDETLKKQKADLLKPSFKVKKAKAQGYEDDDLFKVVTDLQFVTSNNHMDHLAQCHEIRLTNPDILAHEATDQEIKECCKDVRVLGRKELLKLLKWRRSIRKDLTAKLMKSVKETSHSENDETGETDEALDQVTLHSDDEDAESVPELKLDDIEAQQDQEKKKEEKRLKRKEEKRIRDFQQRVQYGMVNDGDVLIEEENDLFNLKKIIGRNNVDKLQDVSPDELVYEQEDPSESMTQNAGSRRVTFSREADIKYFELDKDYNTDEDSDQNQDEGPEKVQEAAIKAPTAILKNKEVNDAFKRLGNNSNVGAGLLTDLMDLNQSKIAAAAKFFDRETFDIDLEKEFETDLVDKLSKTKVMSSESPKRKLSDTDLSKFDDGLGSDEEFNVMDGGNDVANTDSDSDLEDEESMTAKVKKKQIKLDPEGMALATMMFSSAKARKDIEDEGWNRYANGDIQLAPRWFRDEEAEHQRRNVPVSQELVKEYKQRLRDIDAKPIKKVIQAKGRQKRRAMRKMQRVKKKVEAITSNDDLTQRERVNQIKSIYKNATKTKKKEVQTVVARKGLPASKPSKGKYKMVDSRMKKDLRAKQRRESKTKKGNKSSARANAIKKARRNTKSTRSSGPSKANSRKGSKSKSKRR